MSNCKRSLNKLYYGLAYFFAAGHWPKASNRKGLRVSEKDRRQPELNDPNKPDNPRIRFPGYKLGK